MVDLPYPEGPQRVPPSLTRVGLGYRLRVAAVAIALLLFTAGYLAAIGVTGWVAWEVVTSVEAFMRRGRLWPWLAITSASVFLCAFLVKGLFVRARPGPQRLLAVEPDEEPRLFAFLDRLAADTGAPRPRRVYLSPDVNAAVFHDRGTSWARLLPSRKSLILGVGLLNALTLEELKAVVAHELGHVSQSSTRVGAFVHAAATRVEELLFGRDGFDELLADGRRAGSYLSWIAVLLTAMVWVVRKALHVVFLGVARLDASLSREMELHADRVAIAATGSESLMRALHRLRAADASLHYALDELMNASDHGLRTDNVYAHQRWSLEVLRARGDGELDEPVRGERLFDPSAAERPNMWATHPPNHVREAHAARFGIPSPEDDRSAWVLFADPDVIQRRVTALWSPAEAELRPAAEVQAFLDAELESARHDARWGGAFASRRLVMDDIVPLLKADAEPIDGALAHLSDRLAQAARWDADPEARHRQQLMFDRDLFFIHRSLAVELGGAWEKRLLRRYRFHARLQRMVTRVERAERESMQAMARMHRSSSPDGAEHAFGQLAGAHRRIRKLLEKAREVSLPPMPNVRSGATLGELLLAEPLVADAALQQHDPDPEQVSLYFAQLAEIAAKLRRLEDKSLSALLAFQAELLDAVGEAA